MVVYYLKNTLNPDSVVAPVTVEIGFVKDINDGDAENIWIIDFNTKIKDKNGDPIPTKTYKLTEGKTTVEEIIESGLAWVGEQIDWGDLRTDTYRPYVYEYSPTGTTDVPIYAPVYFYIKDPFPTVGIDPNSISLVVNNIDVTSDLKIETFSSYTKVVWNPVRIS